MTGHHEDLAELQKRRILIDGSDKDGILLQIFTTNVIGPIFFEIIQRKGNEGFGEGNFRALVRVDRTRPGTSRRHLRHAVTRRTPRRPADEALHPGLARRRRRFAPGALRPAAGTYEREMSKEGFFGPAAFFYHRHPPTGWSNFEGPLRPRALDLNQLPDGATSPWAAPEVLANGSCRVRYWRLPRQHGVTSRATPTATSCCSCTPATAQLYCDFGHLELVGGRLRDAAARHDVAPRDRRPRRCAA